MNASMDERLAKRLAALRNESGWSLDELAQRSGISRPTLSRMERGETSPTAELLGRLCSVYGKPMSRLIAEVESSGIQYLTKQQQMLWQDPHSGFQRRQVSPPAQGFHAELMEASLPPGAVISYEAPPVVGLEQHLWMLAGTLKLEVGAETYLLKTGDSLRFRVDGSTRFEATGKIAARYALVICQP